MLLRKKSFNQIIEWVENHTLLTSYWLGYQKAWGTWVIRGLDGRNMSQNITKSQEINFIKLVKFQLIINTSSSNPDWPSETQIFRYK